MVTDVHMVELKSQAVDNAIIQQLEEKGLLPRKKKDLPQNPKQIALITSKRSEALSDFEAIYRQQNGQASIQLLDTLVQGEKAPQMIATRIKEANESKKADIILLIRGGGRKEDLSVFSDIVVAQAICRSQIPVVTGIGHQRNETVADRVADQATISPTDAGYKLASLSHQKEETAKKRVIPEKATTPIASSNIKYYLLVALAIFVVIILILIFTQL